MWGRRCGPPFVSTYIADEVAAILQRYGDRELPSTRYKDLVDLVAIVGSASVADDPLTMALESEADRRGLRLPARFDVPDRQLWKTGYAAEAERSLLPAARTLDQALAVVRLFIDPILAGAAAGSWNPDGGRWSS